MPPDSSRCSRDKRKTPEIIREKATEMPKKLKRDESKHACVEGDARQRGDEVQKLVVVVVVSK